MPFGAFSALFIELIGQKASFSQKIALISLKGSEKWILHIKGTKKSQFYAKNWDFFTAFYVEKVVFTAS